MWGRFGLFRYLFFAGNYIRGFWSLQDCDTFLHAPSCALQGLNWLDVDGQGVGSGEQAAFLLYRDLIPGLCMQNHMATGKGPLFDWYM